MDSPRTATPQVNCTFAVHSPAHGTLRVGPLPAGLAERFAAQLRSALLTKVEGAAVSALRIAGVGHEFATIPGVAEDVLSLVETLKQVQVSLHGCARKEVSLDVSGPCTVTAADLADDPGGDPGDDPGVRVADASRVLATVNEGARLTMAVEISGGCGYERVEALQGQRADWIEIDRDYSPVTRVSVDVEAAGTATMLALAVTTNGTVDSAEAVARAVAVLESEPGLGTEAAALCGAIRQAASAPVKQQVTAPAPGRPKRQVRHFGELPADISIPDLVDLQQRSYEWFVQGSCQPQDRLAQGLEGLLRGLFPIELADGRELAYVGYELAPAAMTSQQCLRLGRTYAGALQVRFCCAGAGDVLAVDVCRLPLMTERGTFIIRGREKLVIGQLQADEDTQYNDLTTRRLLLVGRQLEAALAAPLAQDVEAGGRSGSADSLALSRFAEAVDRFFARSRFIRRAETTNPLALVSHLRRVIQRGVRQRPGYDARGMHASHFGRLCLLETPEGESIGVNLNLGVLAGVDDDDRLVTPYRLAGGGIEYLTAAEEADRTIADLNLGDDYQRRYAGKKLARRGSDIIRLGQGEADFLLAHPLQALGTAASLIPFVGHDDPNRALMGANMQKQAVPLLAPQAPLVRTGTETRVAADARMHVKAASAGVVSSVTAERIVVQSESDGDRAYPLTGVSGSSQGTCLRQRPCVRPGDQVSRGQLLADSPASDDGVLALGKTVLVGYVLWAGYNFEDSIVISDRLIRDDVFTSLKVLQFDTTVASAASAAEQLGGDHLPAVDAAKLSPAGLVQEGAAVEEGDVLIGKSRRVVSAGGETNIADTSVRMPVGQRGTVTKVEHYAAARGDEIADDISESVRVTVAVRRPLKVGDKLANRHGAKGTVGLIVPAEQMPLLPDGRALDMALNPIGVPSRMNIGQLLETHLGLAAHELNCTAITPGFNGATVADIEALLAEAKLPAGGMFRLRDGRTGRCFDHESTVGYQYVMKLVHMVDDRVQARCVGEYAEQTEQPIGGRRNRGGQHVGILETLALQGHGAAHTLRDMLTIQADDVTARGDTYDALVAGAPVPRPTVPHSVKRLVGQLRGLCLNLKLFEADGRELDPFQPSASVDDAVAAGIEFAAAETIRTWSAGELADGDTPATFEEWFGTDDGLSIKHIELAVPVRHHWGTAGQNMSEITALPVLGHALRGSDNLDRLYLAVCEANGAVNRAGATDQAKDALQAAVDRLVGDPESGGGLTGQLRGKRGWVTAALSGKTVDYSARSVASPGPELSYDECGLPRRVAKTLFEPIVVGELTRKALAATPDDARRMLHDDDPAALDVLEQVAADRFVLLHRAPALHRLSIQAFRPVVTDEDVVRVHPLTARAFNADFDGDELDVYLPLSRDAQAEAADALRSLRCQLGPADGSYMNFPSQEMIFGCYYATVRGHDAEAVVERYAQLDQVAAAFARGDVRVHDAIVLGSGPDARATTVGRALFNHVLPAELRWLEEPTTNARLRQLLLDCWRTLGPDAAARLGDAVMRFGFRHATRSGLSLGMDLLEQCPRFDARLAEAWRQADELEAQRERGDITEEDLYGQLVEHWWQVSEQMADAALTQLAADRDGFNSLHLMLASGARGSRLQARQLLAMRGLLTAPGGRIYPIPFATTFLRGHSPLEYLAATFGARKGLADTALKSSTAGFLGKRITNAVHDVVITEVDCGTDAGVVKQAISRNGQVIVPLAERIFGRTACGDVTLPGTNQPLVECGQIIDWEAARQIDAADGLEQVTVRSPLTCRAATGVCATCYGTDLSTWQPAQPSLTAGVVAAQSISEPITQLTMRTFHCAVPTMKGSVDQSRPDESIIGGMPRLDELFEAGAAPGNAASATAQRLLDMFEQDGPLATAEYLIAKMHEVYRQQGVRIDDRHYEVVLRQMLGRLRVTDPGDTQLQIGELVSTAQLEAANSATTGTPASAAPTIVGVSQAAVATTDFIAAGASYGGIPALARAAAGKQRIELTAVRNCTAFGKPIPTAPHR